MAELAIVWRNPNRVHHRLRWLHQEKPGIQNVYVIQQRISVERDIWTDSTVLEVIRGKGRKPMEAEKNRSWRMSFGW